MSDERLDSDSLREWVRMLMTPQPYRVFCDNLLREYTPKQFERLVADLFREMGVNVELGPAGADGAIDISLETADGKYIVQCKIQKAPVGVKVVREVYGAAGKYQAKGVFIVTVSEFTSKAEEFTIDLPLPPVRLINGKELFDLMNQHMPTIAADILEGCRKEKND